MIVNRSNISTKKLEAIIRFCTPAACRNLCDVIVKNTREPYSGEFYYNMPDREPYIVLRFSNNKEHFPLIFSLRQDKRDRVGYHGEYHDISLDTNLIRVIGHELHHWYIYSDKKRHHWFYNNRKKIELLADRYSFRKVRQFLKLKEQGIKLTDL